MAEGLLEGVRVLDMTIVFMGPHCTQVLGDYGADVIKVESPTGDTTRQITPMKSKGMGNVFLHLNRNKRSVVLDLKQPDAFAAFLKLAAISDVLVYNIRPKAMARLGITFARMQEVNPRLIMTSLVGFGQDGPYAARPVYEDLLQGLTAVPSMLVKAGAHQPLNIPMAFNDRSVGLYAASAILAALFRRERTGRGMEIEVPMFETATTGVLMEHMAGATFEPPLGPMGYPRSLNPERKPFATKDGYICAVIYTDNHWREFLAMIGQTDRFDTDPALRDLSARTTNAHKVYALIGDELKKRTTADWLAAFDAADIPAAPLHTLEALLTDPHLVESGFFQVTRHPTEGGIRQMMPPGRWSESQPSVRRHAPRLGEHSVELLREAGVDAATIERMISSKATIQA